MNRFTAQGFDWALKVLFNTFCTSLSITINKEYAVFGVIWTQIDN